QTRSHRRGLEKNETHDFSPRSISGKATRIDRCYLRIKRNQSRCRNHFSRANGFIRPRITKFVRIHTTAVPRKFHGSHSKLAETLSNTPGRVSSLSLLMWLFPMELLGACWLSGMFDGLRKQTGLYSKDVHTDHTNTGDVCAVSQLVST